MADDTINQLIDVAALQAFVHANVPGATEPLDVQKHVAGFSNETFYVSRLAAAGWRARIGLREGIADAYADFLRRGGGADGG